MNRAVAASLLATIGTVAATLTVQFPQYAVWFTIAGTVSAGLLQSPLFAKKPEAKP